MLFDLSSCVIPRRQTAPSRRRLHRPHALALQLDPHHASALKIAANATGVRTMSRWRRDRDAHDLRVGAGPRRRLLDGQRAVAVADRGRWDSSQPPFARHVGAPLAHDDARSASASRCRRCRSAGAAPARRRAPARSRACRPAASPRCRPRPDRRGRAGTRTGAAGARSRRRTGPARRAAPSPTNFASAATGSPAARPGTR